MGITQYADNHVHLYGDTEAGHRALSDLDALGITDANLLAYTYLEGEIDHNLNLLYYKATEEKIRLRVFGGLYYNRDLNFYTMPFQKQAEMLIDMGCDGIKFLDMKPNYSKFVGFRMDSPLYDDLFDWLEEKQIPLISHVADPESFWHRETMTEYQLRRGWCYDGKGFPTRDELYESVWSRMRRNPKLNIAFAHFLFLADDLPRAQWVLDTFPNVRFDLTPGWRQFVSFAEAPDVWRDFFLRYRTRMLYGTDTTPFARLDYTEKLHASVREFLSRDFSRFPIPHEPHSEMCGLNLDAETQHMICYENYMDFVGTDIRPIDPDRTEAHSEALRAIARRNGNDALDARIVHCSSPFRKP